MGRLVPQPNMQNVQPDYIYAEGHVVRCTVAIDTIPWAGEKALPPINYLPFVTTVRIHPKGVLLQGAGCCLHAMR